MKHSPRHSPSDSARHSLGDSSNHSPKYSWRHSRRYFDILRHSLRYLAKHSLRYFSRYSLQYTLNHFLFVYSPFRGVKIVFVTPYGCEYDCLSRGSVMKCFMHIEAGKKIFVAIISVTRKQNSTVFLFLFSRDSAKNVSGCLSRCLIMS